MRIDGLPLPRAGTEARSSPADQLPQRSWQDHGVLRAQGGAGGDPRGRRRVADAAAAPARTGRADQGASPAARQGEPRGMIAWLLAFLALVGVNWVPPRDVAGLSRWGWSAPSSGPRDHAGEQPANAATPLQRDGVGARFLEHGGALQRPALGPLYRGRPLLVTAVPGDSCCRRAPDGRARRKRNARAGALALAVTTGA